MIYIALIDGRFFGRASTDWRSLDVEVMAETLRAAGHQVAKIPIEVLHERQFQPDDIVWYATHHRPPIQRYVLDLIHFVSKRVTVVPSHDLLVCHENKGAQELLRIERDLPGIRGRYVYREADLPAPPYVLKNTTGAGSASVFLVRTKADLSKVRHRVFPSGLSDRLKRMVRLRRLSGEDARGYSLFRGPLGQAVAQPFIPGLKQDHKVLVFGQRIYVLTRQVRKGDFRASGSGLFDWAPVHDDLLSYAEAIHRRLDTPYVSLDIARTEFGFETLEFQAINFGPLTLSQSNGWYERDPDGRWRFTIGTSDLSTEAARAFLWRYPSQPRPRHDAQ
jgi:hypothetical protein